VSGLPQEVARFEEGCPARGIEAATTPGRERTIVAALRPCSRRLAAARLTAREVPAAANALSRVEQN
jgi:hypothetical protein